VSLLSFFLLFFLVQAVLGPLQRLRALAVFLCLSGLLLSGPLFPVERVGVQVERLATETWVVEGLDLQAVIRESTLELRLVARQLLLGEEQLEVADLQLHCSSLVLLVKGSRCDSATVAFSFAPWKRVAGGLAWYQDAETLQVEVERLRLGRGRLKASLSRKGQQWQLKLPQLRLALRPLVAWRFPRWRGDGTVTARGSASLEGSGLWQAAFSLESGALGFSDAEALHVGEGLGGRVVADLQGSKDSMGGALELEVRSGQLYLDPFFVEFSADKPLAMEVLFSGRPQEARWELRHFAASYPGVLQVEGSGTLVDGVLKELQMNYRVSDLEGGYALLQPLLIGTPLDALEMGGKAQGELEVVEGGVQRVQLQLNNADLEDGQAHRFGFRGLESLLRWRREGAGKGSILRWQEGHLYRVKLGSLDARLLASGDRLAVEPFSLELLGGRLRLRDLRLEGLLAGGLKWQASALFRGIRLERVSEALAWPPMEGEMNADIPQVHYRDGRLRLDGELVVEVFGGRVVIEGLRIEDLLGVAPVLETSIRLENLDLAQISRTFSFGRIEGSLEGRIRNLQLVGWELAAFEAELRSPARDPRPHRISQKAIDNLTELGNGVAAGLSGTFLGMFKDFAYDRLQLSIRLEGDTAELDGAPGPKGGYYIVKGARLPRVDVIGRNRRVAWKDLLSRLKEIRFEGVVVE
jgi:hypothetical protein